MPQIKQYSASVDASGPIQGRRATAEDFGGNGGLDAVGKGITSVGNYIEQKAEQDDALNSAKGSADASIALNKFIDEKTQSGDITKPEFMDQFNQYAGETFSKIGDGISTAKGKESWYKRQEALTAQYTINAWDSASKARGADAKNKINEQIKTMSSQTYTNPQAFDMNLSQVDHTVTELRSTGLLRSPQEETAFRDMARTEMATSAVKGWIDKNPQYAKEQLKDGKWDAFIDGDHKASLDHQANEGIRGQEIERERIKRKQTDALAVAQTATQNDFLAKMVKGELSDKDILRSGLDPFGSGSKKQFLDMLHADNGKNKTDPAVMNDLFARANLPDGDPKKLIDENDLNKAFIDGNLGKSDLDWLRGEMQGKRTPEGKMNHQLTTQAYAQAKAALIRPDPVMGQKDPLGEQQYASFLLAFSKEINEGQKSGKSMVDMLDPNSKDFVTGKLIDRFKKTPQQIMQTKLEMMRANPPNSNDSYGPQPLPGVGAQAPKAAEPAVGEVRSGYVFKGGNWRDKSSWEKQ